MIQYRAFVAAAAACLFAASAQAQANYPDRPIKLVVGYAPGGFTDVAARLVANDLQKRIGQAVIVENKAGATGTLAADFVAKAKPDGYTLLLAHQNSNAVAPALFPKLPYNVVTDFTPIVQVASTPLLLVVGAQSPAKDLKDVVALARKDKGGLKFGSSGNGSSQHIGAALFMQATGVEMTHIPYKGSAQALTDLLSGQIDLSFDSPPPTLQFIQAGKLRALGVTSAHRMALLPNVPTMAEAGVPGFEFSQWFGVVGPAGLSAAVQEKLNAAVNAGLKSPEVRERLAALGAEPLGGTSEEFGKVIKADTARFAELTKKANITAD